MYKQYASLPGMVQARPITLGEYYELIGCTTPEEENSEDQGYLINKGDDTVDYLPKELFETAFVIADTPIDHLRNDLESTTKDRERLTNFLKSEVVKKSEDRLNIPIVHIQHRLTLIQETILLFQLQQAEYGLQSSTLFKDMDYSTALLFLKSGFKVMRKHWAGKNKYLSLVLGEQICINGTMHDEQVDKIWYYGPDGRGAYTPQQCDMIKEDWIVIFD